MSESVVHGEANKTVNRRRAFGGVALLVGARIAGEADGARPRPGGWGSGASWAGPGAGRGSLLPALP